MALEFDECRITVTMTSNININVIMISEDKLKNVLMPYVSKMNKPKDWLGALAAAISILLALLTSDFRETFGIPKEYIEAVFVMACLGFFVFTGFAIRNYKKSKVKIDDIIASIKAKGSYQLLQLSKNAPDQSDAFQP